MKFGFATPLLAVGMALMSLKPANDKSVAPVLPTTVKTDTVKPQTPKVVEQYRLNWLNITTNGNDINFTFNATSLKDTTREDGKEYATATGNLTVMQLKLEDNALGAFGRDLPDVRASFEELEFLNPNYSNYAAVKITINTNTGVSKIPTLSVNPHPGSEEPPYDVHQIILISDEENPARVTINGDNLGRNSHIARNIMANTVLLGDGEDAYGARSFKIDYTGYCGFSPYQPRNDRRGFGARRNEFRQSWRKVYPEGSTLQLPGVQEDLVCPQPSVRVSRRPG